MKKKTIIIIVLVVALFLVVGVYFLWKKYAPVEVVPKPDTAITYTKGVNIMPYHIEERDIEQTMKDVKDYGANLVAINLDLGLDENGEFVINPGPPDLDIERHMALLIAEAHQRGLQTELRPVTGAPIFQQNRSLDYESFFSKALTFFAHWAKFAEKNDVYRFTLFGEVDSLRGYFMTDFEEKVPSFSKSLFDEVKKYYHGEIGMGFLPPDVALEYNMSGFDYIEISIYIHPGNPYESWEEAFNSRVDNIQPLLEKSGIDTLIMGETGVVTDREKVEEGWGIDVTYEGEAEYYELLFSTLKDRLDGFITAFGDGDVVLGEPAEEVIKKWYCAL